MNNDKEGDIFLCYCKDCREYFLGTVRRWKMYYCQHCKKTAVDLEEGYGRLIGNVRIIRKLKKPKNDIL